MFRTTRVVVSMVAVLAASSSVAWAAGGTVSPNSIPTGGGGTSNSVFLGYSVYKSSLPWASAHIEINDNPYINGSVSESTPPLTACWTMIDKEGTDAYAQVGLIKLQGYSQAYYFFQENDNNNEVYSVLDNGSNNGGVNATWNTSGATGPSLYTEHTYTVDDDNGTFRAYVDGKGMNFFKTPAIEWSPNEAEYMNEVQYESYARFYGSSSSPTYWYHLAWKTSLSGSVQYNDLSSWNSSNYGRFDGTSNWGTSSNAWWSYDSRS